MSRDELDALAEFAGVNLELVHDDSAPLPYSVWSMDETGDAELVGAGLHPADAIAGAREQIQQWQANGSR